MIFDSLVRDVDCWVQTIEKVRLALVGERKLEGKEELDESTIRVVSVDCHEDV